MLLLDSQVEPIVLRESIRARITVAPISILGSFLSIVLFIPLIASQGVTYTRITLWAVPILVLVVARGILSRWINEWLDAASEPEIIRSDRALRISSIANQAAVGMGIWIVQPPSAGNSVLPLFMTLIAVIWSIGVMANLFSDFKSFIMSLPFLLGPVAGFWLLQGGPGDFGVPVGISMLLAMVLMVMLVHRGTSIFRESVLIRC